MPKKLLFFFFIHASIYAQTNRTVFFGKISDELGLLENVHIINLNTNQATHTNPFGKFKIFARVKDSLKITSVGYRTKILILKPSDFGIIEKQIILKKEIIELDEIEIKKHNLIGSLEYDIKQVPQDRIQELVDNAMASVMNMKFDPVIEKIDEIDRMKAPIVNTDPIGQGISIFSTTLGGNSKIKYAKINFLKKKQQLPQKLIKIIGRKMIVTEFKIPEQKIQLFLDFCSYNKNIERYVDDNETFKLIELLNEESIAYLKIIDKNE